MLKRLFTITIALSIFLALNTFADASSTLKTSQIISDVAYDKYDNQLYIYTENAADAGMWVLDVELNKGETLKQLQKRLVGHKIDIYYVMDNREYEIVRTEIH